MPIPLVGTIPATVFVAFQLMFAIIAVALISGAVADRMRFGAWLAFTALWVIPVAYWVFAFDGATAADGGWILNKLKAIDFAGGTAVHINAGAAGLVLALVLGKRHGWPREPMRPHNLPFVMLGSGLLWFGWYGFNAGSAGTANGAAGTTFITTTVATCAGMLAWLAVERLRDGHATSLGAASGIIAGLVGTLMVGLVATAQAPAGVSGLLYGGGLDQLWRQAVGAGVVLVYSLVCTTAIAYALKFTIGLRTDQETEMVGIDESQHAESAYDFAPQRGGRPSTASRLPIPANQEV